MELNMEKKWYKSKTLWFNVIALLAVLLDDILKANIVTDPEVVALLVTVANVLLRFQTFASLTK